MGKRWFALFRLTALCSLICWTTSFEATAQQSAIPPGVVKIHFKSIHCEGCATKIRSRLFAVAGVSTVATSVKDKLAVVTPVEGKQVSARAMWQTLEEGKYKIDRMETADETIKEMPAE